MLCIFRRHPRSPGYVFDGVWMCVFESAAHFSPDKTRPFGRGYSHAFQIAGGTQEKDEVLAAWILSKSGKVLLLAPKLSFRVSHGYDSQSKHFFFFLPMVFA